MHCSKHVTMVRETGSTAKKPPHRKKIIGFGELSSLHRSLTTPVLAALKPTRPYTSAGPEPPSPSKVRHQPPAKLLPPHAPPKLVHQKSFGYSSTLFPSLIKVPLKKTKVPRRTVSAVKRKSSLLRKSGRTVQISTCHEQQDTLVCRLCGAGFSSGDMLHAHLLLFRHSAPELVPNGDDKCRDTTLSCRQCGVAWLAVKDESKCLSHPCLLQKAAYFKNILAPCLKIRQGLPFVCLFCCPEREEDKPINNRRMPARRRPPPSSMRKNKKKLSFRMHQTAARFESKLDLAIHILYFHAPMREVGHCYECVKFNYEPEKTEPMEYQFWINDPSPPQSPRVLPKITLKCHGDEKSSESEASIPSAPSPTPSSDSILERDGLHALDRHIEDDHAIVYKYLAWVFSKRGISDLSSHTSQNRTSWIYACPLCQIQPSTFSFKDKAPRPEFGMSGNAMLQTHLACFHAGASFLDWKTQVCQVCGESVLQDEHKSHESGELSSPRQRHIVKRGHLTKMKKQYTTAVSQGRLPEVGGWHHDVDWRRTCVLCWKKFGVRTDHDARARLRAECQLQTHLITTHCVFSQMGVGYREDVNLLSCGWCGHLCDKIENGKLFK